MRTEAKVFWFIVIFFGVVTPIYWFMSKEIIGTIALGFTTGLGLMIAAFLQYQARNFDARPEDRQDGEIYEGAGTYGFFPPSSIWPFFCAVVVTLIFIGAALGQGWIALIGFGVGIWACSGWVLQYYRGDYQH
ncbi:MAG: cytochrome c oxidase subunit 4 [Propionibacterium sp.]|nr:cytochrome c oxidase subunit 4 [Propionibacterium sp.]